MVREQERKRDTEREILVFQHPTSPSIPYTMSMVQTLTA